MGQIRLADTDRARISAAAGKDLPEWLDVDILGVTNREAVTLARWHPAWRTPFLWRRALAPADDDDALAGLDALVVSGVLPDPAAGAVLAARQRLSDLSAAAGEVSDPAEQLLAWTALVWLALRRAGVDLPLDEVEFDTDRLSTRADADDPPPEPSPGKGPGDGLSGSGGPG